MPRVINTVEPLGVDTTTVARIVPEAYLWWQKDNEAWTIPIGYDFG